MKIYFDRIKAMNNVKNKKVIEHLFSQNPQSKYLQLDLARIWMEEDQLDQADHLLQSVLENNLEDNRTMLKICQVFFDHFYFEKAYKVIEKIPPNKLDVALLVMKTNCLLSLKAPEEEVKKVAQDILRIEPRNDFATLCLADLDRKNEQYESAIAKCHLILDNNPRNVRANQLLLNCTYLHRPQDALAAFDFKGLVRSDTLERAIIKSGKNVIDFNRLLVEEMNAFSGWRNNPKQYTTTNGHHLDNFASFEGAHFLICEGFIQQKIIDYFESVSQLRKAYFDNNFSELHLSLNAWGVRLHSGGHQTPHLHAKGWISGVYYVSLPTFKSEIREGALEFGILEKDKSFTPLHFVQPIEGQLVLFPSYLLHRTVPFHNSKERICISFDVFPSSNSFS